MKNKLIGVFVLAAVLVAGNFLSAQKPVPEGTPLERSLDGKVLYRAYCASCHGLDARGDGPMAASLKVAPSDLTRLYARNGRAFPAQRVGKIISGEAAVPGGHGTSEMPVWGPFFSRVENDQDLGLMRINALVRYLQHIQGE
jgi:mono/diheme cytochrome c family protein